MGKLSEHEVVAFFVGKIVNPLRLSSVEYARCPGSGSYKDCIEHTINASDLHLENGIYRHTYHNIKSTDLKILLYLTNGFIKGIRIFKYKTIIYPEGLTSGYETTPSSKDIDLVNNVLKYVTHAEEREDDYEGD